MKNGDDGYLQDHFFNGSSAFVFGFWEKQKEENRIAKKWVLQVLTD